MLNNYSSALRPYSYKDVFWLNEFVSDRAVIQQYLSAANIYAFPSRLEGFLVASIEMIACGLSVVAADAPDVPIFLKQVKLLVV